MRFLPFRAKHCMNVKAHPSQSKYQSMLDKPETIPPDSWSVFDGDTLLGIGGLVDIEGRAYGWALFSDQVEPRHFVALHRAVLRVMKELEGMGEPLSAHIDPQNPVGV